LNFIAIYEKTTKFKNDIQECGQYLIPIEILLIGYLFVDKT